MTYINHFTAQFAGEVGLISLGLGKEFKKYSVGGMYGIVPGGMAGGPLIETIALRQTYTFYSWERLSFYGGLNIFHVFGIKYRTEDYGNVPDNYYPIGSIRALLNAGVSAAFNPSRTRYFYFEAGYNDLSIENLVNANNDVVNPVTELSLAFGLKQMF